MLASNKILLLEMVEYHLLIISNQFAYNMPNL